jgi:hypothetical protein
MSVEAYLLAAIASLAAAVIALWRNDVTNHARERVEWKAQIADLTGRIRGLEEARHTDAVQHGHELKAIAERLSRELTENSAVLRGVRDAFTSFSGMLTSRPCGSGFEPQALTARPITENITRKHDHE